jgi:hypothetical protein
MSGGLIACLLALRPWLAPGMIVPQTSIDNWPLTQSSQRRALHPNPRPGEPSIQNLAAKILGGRIFLV